MGNTYAKKGAHNGGMNMGAKRQGKAAKGGKIASQAAPPLPKQKLAKGSGIAGRNSNG